MTDKLKEELLKERREMFGDVSERDIIEIMKLYNENEVLKKIKESHKEIDIKGLNESQKMLEHFFKKSSLCNQNIFKELSGIYCTTEFEIKCKIFKLVHPQYLVRVSDFDVYDFISYVQDYRNDSENFKKYLFVLRYLDVNEFIGLTSPPDYTFTEGLKGPIQYYIREFKTIDYIINHLGGNIDFIFDDYAHCKDNCSYCGRASKQYRICNKCRRYRYCNIACFNNHSVTCDGG